MKKVILSLIIILISTNTLQAKKFNWEKISTTQDDSSSFYLDKKSAYKVGQHVYYWMLTNFYLPSDEFKSSITHNMVRCKTFENKYISMVTFSKINGKGDILLDFIVPEDVPDMFNWEKFPKNSSQGAVLEKVCTIW